MAVISFIAKRALAAGYISGQEYDIEFQCAAFELDMKAVTEDSVSLSGVRETVLHRTEQMWDITTGAMIGAPYDQFACFLASVSDGTPFTFDRWATISNGTILTDRPLLCELSNDMSPRKRLGNRLDAFQYSFKIRAIEDPSMLYGENFYWDLDLTRGVVPDGWTYIRTGTMYAMDTDGIFKPYSANIMPTHYDAVAGKQLGAWFGPSTTNSLLYSSDISAAEWVAQNITKADCTSIIQGGTAKKITNTATSGVVRQDVGTFGSNQDTVFAIIEKGDSDKARVALYDITAGVSRAEAELTFSTGTVIRASGTDASSVCRGYKLAEVGPNGGQVWVLALTTSPGALTNGNSRRIYIYASDYTSSSQYGYLHHVQLHANSTTATVISPPIVTTSTALTRGVDILKYIGNPVWWKGSNFSTCVEYERKDSNPPGSTPHLIAIGPDTSNYVGVYASGATSRTSLATVGGVTQSSLTMSASQNARHSKVACRFNTNDFAASLDGSAPSIDSAGSLPAAGKFNVGSAPSDSSQSSAFISRAVIDYKGLTNAELQAWTT